MANNKSYQNRAPKGHLASLTPEVQVHKILTDIKDLKNGHDLRNWSASARKELKSAPIIKLQVGKEPVTTIKVPKLALIIASPVVRQYMNQKPSATSAKFVHPNVDPHAMASIAKWLEATCDNHKFSVLPMPEDLEKALLLRRTAYTLGMEGYAKHFDYEYSEAVGSRVPGIEEVNTVVKYAFEAKDGILPALANRIAYLRRYHKISDVEEAAYAELLADAKYQCLKAVVNHQKVRAMARREGD